MNKMRQQTRQNEKIIKQKELIYLINEEEKTADIVGNECIENDLVIPRTINNEGQEYIVKSIKEKSFCYSEVIRIVRFAEDSEVELIEKDSFVFSSIEEIYLPSHLKTIEPHSFSVCNQLHIVDIPQNSELQTIGAGAFKFTMIETLTLPSSILELEEGWCDETPYLINVIYSPNANYLYLDGKYIIGKSDRCKDDYDVLIYARRNLDEAIIPSFVRIFGASSFEHTKIQSIHIQSQVTEIHPYAFSKCKNLAKVHFEKDSQLRVIGKGAFLGSSITSIYIPPHVEEICKGVFENCARLARVDFATDSELQIIGESFISTSIQSISIPSSVIEIHREAFYECYNLSIINIPEDSKLQVISEFAFGYTLIESLYIPANVSRLDDGWCKCTEYLREVKVSQDNKHFQNYGSNNEFVIGKSDENGDEFDVLLFANRKQKILIIPPFIEKIGHSSFDCAEIERITIPKNVTQICTNAFGGCSHLRYVDIEANSKLQIIDESAFEATSIVSFQVPPRVARISKDAFSECMNIQIIEIDENSAFEPINNKTFVSNQGEYYFVMIPSKLCIGTNE